MRSALRGLVVTSLLCCFLIQIPAQTANPKNIFPGNGKKYFSPKAFNPP